MSGSCIAFPWAADHVNAILQVWYPGESGGTAVADVLLGKVNPAGRLPITFYRSTADLPAFEDYSLANRTYRFFKGAPLYSFGHGLSYTQFSYSRIAAKLGSLSSPALASVSLDVTNTGGREGDEVVQLYAAAPATTVPRDCESLCGFRRIHLAPGETKTVNFDVSTQALRR